MSRLGLDRLLRRRGNSRLPVAHRRRRAHTSRSKAYEPGYTHIDVKYLPQMADEASRRYAFVAIDRATRWVFIAIKSHKTAAARLFLSAVAKAAPMKIRTLLTDNGRGVHRPLVWQASKRGIGSARVRCAVPSAGHRASSTEHRLTQAEVAPDQRHGRASQWPAVAGAALAPLTTAPTILAKTVASLRLAVQPAFAAEDVGSPNPSAGAQTMANLASSSVCQTGWESSGTRHLSSKISDEPFPIIQGVISLT